MLNCQILLIVSRVSTAAMVTVICHFHEAAGKGRNIVEAMKFKAVVDYAGGCLYMLCFSL